MEITNEQLAKLFELAGIEYKNIYMTGEFISKALIEIERKMNFFELGPSSKQRVQTKVLIADDLELSLYQLTKLFNKIGINPLIARNIDEANDLLKKHTFNYVLTYIYLPECGDGFRLIKSLINYKNKQNKNLKIVAISGSHDKQIIAKALELGADKFIVKSKDWHSDILNFLGETIERNQQEIFSKHTIENNTIYYTVYNMASTYAINELAKDINLSVLSKYNEILLDLSKVFLFDKENVNIFVDIFKLCSQNNIKCSIINPSEVITNALSFAYLNDVIPIINK